MNQYRFNRIYLLVTDSSNDVPPNPTAAVWRQVFYEPGYVVMVRQMDLRLKARRVTIYSSSTEDTNPLFRWNVKVTEQGVLAFAELEVYGAPAGKTINSTIGVDFLYCRRKA